MSIKKIAISTGGGDAPGLNAVIKAVVFSAIKRGWECVGILDGYNGIFPEEYPDGSGIINLTKKDVWNIAHLGGTILGTTNKGDPFSYTTLDEAGNTTQTDRSDEVIEIFRKNKVDALIAIGGDGSLSIANRLAQKGLKVIGVPKTIDNDLDKTVITFGFDTAISFATEAIERLQSTAQAHRRIMIVEVMGRYAGWIALHSGIAGGADIILIPEIFYKPQAVADKILEIEATGRKHAVVVVAEGAKEKDGKTTYMPMNQGVRRLGGIGEIVTNQIHELTGKDSRNVVLGHLLRGGSPTTFDRLLSFRFGAAAVRALEEGESGIMVALDPPTVKYVPLALATNRMKRVPIQCDTMLTAKDLGISFGN